MKPWTTVSSTSLIDDEWLRLRADSCLGRDEVEIAPYYVIDENDWVQIFATNQHGQILVVKQYRHAAGVFCTELPGGVIDSGESALDAAQRELAEETGYQAQSWKLVGRFYANPARQTNSIHVFIASELEGGVDANLDASEEIECAFHTPGEIEQQIERGEFSQGLHIASYYMCLRANSD